MTVETGRGWLCLTVGHRARFDVSNSGGTGRGLLCVTAGHRARFAVYDSGAQGEIGCV